MGGREGEVFGCGGEVDALMFGVDWLRVEAGSTTRAWVAFSITFAAVNAALYLPLCGLDVVQTIAVWRGVPDRA